MSECDNTDDDCNLKDDEKDKVGIYYDNSTNTAILNLLREILDHLHLINRFLELLDGDLAKLRSSLKAKLDQDIETKDELDYISYHERQIQKEMEIFHLYQNHCLRVLTKIACHNTL